MKDFQILLIFAFIFLILLGIAEFLFRILKLPTEITRKFAHISTGLVTLCIPYYFSNHIAVLLLTILFLGLLIISKRVHIFKSIDAIDRKTSGSYLFPISIYICFLLSSIYQDKAIFVVSILILSVSDTLAAIIGKRIKSKTINSSFVKDKKTVAGSTAFFLSAVMIISISLFNYYDLPYHKAIFYAIIFSIVITFIEMLSTSGYDNLFVPIAVSLMLLAI